MSPKELKADLLKLKMTAGSTMFRYGITKTLFLLQKMELLMLHQGLKAGLFLIPGPEKKDQSIALLSCPCLLKSELKGDSILFKAHGKNKIVIWKGNPSYKTVSKEFNPSRDTIVRIKDIFRIL